MTEYELKKHYAQLLIAVHGSAAACAHMGNTGLSKGEAAAELDMWLKQKGCFVCGRITDGMSTIMGRAVCKKHGLKTPSLGALA